MNFSDMKCLRKQNKLYARGNYYKFIPCNFVILFFDTVDPNKYCHFLLHNLCYICSTKDQSIIIMSNVNIESIQSVKSNYV